MVIDVVVVDDSVDVDEWIDGHLRATKTKNRPSLPPNIQRRPTNHHTFVKDRENQLC